MIGVLFVCTGNICRSPTAEGLFRHALAQAGLAERIVADSAGTHDYHIGAPPDPRSIEAAARRGIDLSGLRARRIEPADFERFTYVLAMDRGHHRILSRLAPRSRRGRLRLYLDFAPQLGLKDVPDPYYGDGDGFEHVLDLVEETNRCLLDHIRRHDLQE